MSFFKIFLNTFPRQGSNSYWVPTDRCFVPTNWVCGINPENSSGKILPSLYQIECPLVPRFLSHHQFLNSHRLDSDPVNIMNKMTETRSKFLSASSRRVFSTKKDMRRHYVQNFHKLLFTKVLFSYFLLRSLWLKQDQKSTRCDY